MIFIPILAIGRWVRQLSRATQDRVADASSQSSEILNGVQTVQSFVNEEDGKVRENHRAKFHHCYLRIRVRALFSTVATTSVWNMIFVLWLGANDVLAGEISGGELGQFVLCAIFVGVSAATLSEIWGELQRAAGAMERLRSCSARAIQAPEHPVEFLTHALAT